MKKTLIFWVTGKHAVKEDGVWKRIENSRKASVVYDHNVTEVLFFIM